MLTWSCFWNPWINTQNNIIGLGIYSCCRGRMCRVLECWGGTCRFGVLFTWILGHTCLPLLSWICSLLLLHRGSGLIFIKRGTRCRNGRCPASSLAWTCLLRVLMRFKALSHSFSSCLFFRAVLACFHRFFDGQLSDLQIWSEMAAQMMLLASNV